MAGVIEYWPIIVGLVTGGAAYGHVFARASGASKRIADHEIKCDVRAEKIYKALNELTVAVARVDERTKNVEKKVCG